MAQASAHLPMERKRSVRPRVGELGPATQSAGNVLAIGFLLFGIACACFLPLSLEQRIAYLLSTGLAPAVVVYAGSRVLSQLLASGTRLCETVVSCCLTCFMRLLSCLAARRSASEASTGHANASAAPASFAFSGQSRETLSFSDRCRLARAACTGGLTLLARNGARYLIECRRLTLIAWRLLSGRGLQLRRQFITATLVAALGLGWWGGNLFFDLLQGYPVAGVPMDVVVDRIIRIESGGDPNVTNKRSSATGLGQFLDETWLDLIRTHRADLAKQLSRARILELRRDPKVAREITMRFTEQNARTLRKRDLPVTPGTLYLAHFAGGGGAVAVLSALQDADAATVMANADESGRTKREKIVRANPFIEGFTIADLRNWADRKMRFSGL
jgi:hypothetical protein